MAVVKHVSAVKGDPLAMLKYITGETKATPAAFVTGLNCSDDTYSAYMEMALCYEMYAREKFAKSPVDGGKGKIKMHHYVLSFKNNEVSAEKAHKIGIEFAEKAFGQNQQVLVCTHNDTKNVHVHFAVSAYDLKGRHWIDNQRTLKQLREISDKILHKHHLSVIENPKRKKSICYTEHLARRNGTSWKKRLCDDIDRIIVVQDVRNISDLANELRRLGYEVNENKYLSITPQGHKAIRSFRLGDGYSIEHLQYRIENKDREMPLERVLTYSGIQRDQALCLHSMQQKFYRKEDGITYDDLLRHYELLNYIHSHAIHSRDEFEDHVNSVAAECDEIINQNLGSSDKDYDLAIRRKNAVTDHYKTFLRMMDSEILAHAINELKDLEEKLPQPEPYKLSPMNDRAFINAVEGIGIWAEKVRTVYAEKRRREAVRRQQRDYGRT